MRRTFFYWTGGPTEDDARRGLNATVAELGHDLVDALIKPSAPPHATGGFEVSFTLELPDTPDPLLDRIERFLRETPPKVPVSLSFIGVPFGDLFWEPVDRREFWINETVRLDGPTAYGVIGYLSGEYRICVCSNVWRSKEDGFLAAETDLHVAVARVLRFLEQGGAHL